MMSFSMIVSITAVVFSEMIAAGWATILQAIWSFNGSYNYTYTISLRN